MRPHLQISQDTAIVGEPARYPVKSPVLSVVIPAYNEAAVLLAFFERLVAVLNRIDMKAEIVFVNDGSSDSTLSLMRRLAADDPRVGIVDLSRNFGKEIAMTAGLDHAQGEAVILIDADLQDPPELIPALIAQWRAGYDVVYAKRTARNGETFVKKATARLFYRLIQQVGRVKIPEDTGDFRLLSRRAVASLSQLREQHRFMKGLFSWIGYPQIAVPYAREPRFAGATKWNYWRLWNFAIEGFTSFTIAPLKIATYVGLSIALLAFAFAAFIVCRTLLYGNPVQGYPSLMVVILLLGGTQLMAIGVLGEYVGRMFNEAKHRPLYFVNHYREARAGTRCVEAVEIANTTSHHTVAASSHVSSELRPIAAAVHAVEHCER